MMAVEAATHPHPTRNANKLTSIQSDTMKQWLLWNLPPGTCSSFEFASPNKSSPISRADSALLNQQCSVTGVYFVTNYLGHVGVPGQS